jgi:predicted esterase
MPNVKAIEEAVQSLPPSALAEFRRWFADFDGAAWDRQIETDLATGKLDSLLAEAEQDWKSPSSRAL